MRQAPYRLFAELSRIADEIGSKFLVVGGHAVGFYGVPRETADVDVVIVEEFAGGWISALELLKYGVYNRNPNFVQLHHVDGRDWPVDLILLDANTFSRMEARSATTEIGDLVLPLPALNDLIAMKLHALKQGLAHRYAKDFQDVQVMVERNGIDLQNDAIIQMFLKFGSEDIYKQICHACDSSPEELL